MTKKMVKAFLNGKKFKMNFIIEYYSLKGLMVESTLEDGEMVSSMEKELLLHQLDKRKKVNGNKVRENDGSSLKKEMIESKSKLKIS